jgi:hypothetical protein
VAEKECRYRQSCWPFFQVDPHLKNLHQKPRFHELVAALEREFSGLKIQGSKT